MTFRDAPASAMPRRGVSGTPRALHRRRRRLRGDQSARQKTSMAITHTDARGAVARRGWVEPMARTGYLTKGVVYVLIGVLAILAVTGAGSGAGEIGGPETAVRTIGEQPFGQVLLTIVGIGLFAYAAWRLVQAILDPERAALEGGKGVAKRIGWGVSGVLHAALGVAALQMAFAGRAPREGGSESWVGEVLSWDAGPVLVVAAGAAVILFALYEIYRAWTIDFTRHLKITQMTPTERRWSIRAGRIGLFARGVVLVIVGAGIVEAGLNARPGEAEGLGGALRDIAQQPYGAILLIVVAVGLVAYGVFQMVEARYRRIPTRA
ncbi:DUF1206 domain-containing protein [Sandaracinus amylolyticus]|uniref:DUF1206 domain-containing protein n=1 Tax=Sandaracinus amylolyticus TaxID=927083 RepID=UPI001F3275CC|nr:DUF1206 domain-containing protein [Sandaracinus amylolyticus]